MLKTITRQIPAFALAAAFGAVTLSPAFAADGKALYADKGCAACHGEDAKTPLQEGFPKLAGQSAEYIANQIKDIKSGARKNGQTVDTMKPIVEDLAEADAKAIADYLFSLKEAPAAAAAAPAAGAPHPGKTLFLTKTCVACHGKEGKKPLPGYPMIGGQDKAYILAQTKDIKSGARANGKANAMQPVMHLVNDDEIGQIADYLSTVK
ncbi:Cytochrome c553 [Paramagnetospirillum magnetotacticum MS-1]|uniref:Cytochrome c553 n=1 Tax=Paramagnetospirillum magnetotacticum MS-1 TaxID=272627 RepID=A0A0C2V4S3_PARME|nr:c-type cytochrome [Paramagnetospirillum magnetotacticum]KIM00077.1 Cytochrome c553 [Paramagnetospirillum magnetotacticum MS-1]